jgi:hypothetical protein
MRPVSNNKLPRVDSDTGAVFRMKMEWRTLVEEACRVQVRDRISCDRGLSLHSFIGDHPPFLLGHSHPRWKTSALPVDWLTFIDRRLVTVIK